MKHVRHAQLAQTNLPEDFVIRATGRYYTHDVVATHLLRAVAKHIRGSVRENTVFNVCDPFAGDGRLIQWLLEFWCKSGLPRLKWRIGLWDLNAKALSSAVSALDKICAEKGIQADVSPVASDAFQTALPHKAEFNLVVTNPPWEILKPDRRELKQLPPAVRKSYIATMRGYDNLLATNFPESQPKKKFAGWGTNLSRVGLDLCRFICKKNGFIAIVMPASFLADEQSFVLRQAILLNNNLLDAAYFPAEAKLFGRADVSTSTLLVQKGSGNSVKPKLTTYTKCLRVENRGRVQLKRSFLEQFGFVLPISFGSRALELLDRLATQFSTWQEMEGKEPTDLWAGRELDETGSSNWLQDEGNTPLFIKGRMIDRYSIRIWPSKRIKRPGWTPPPSTYYERIAWRDVSRPSQKRRMIATIIPAGLVAGNSLGIAHFRDASGTALRALLGVVNSLCFELQLRSHLATGHVSLSALRKVHLPPRKEIESTTSLIDAVERSLAGDLGAAAEVEAIVARNIFRLTRDEVELVLGLFPKLTKIEKEEVLVAYENQTGR